MGENYVWMCMYHGEIFVTEDSVRNHEFKMECVATLIRKEDADYYRFILEKFLINLLK
jgi:hypothetical protein